MAFRRQDIPKMTRKGKDGAPRRIFPRFIRDQTMHPKVGLAIDYLEGMIGRKRSELSPDVVLDLFGDPKLARCMLACLAESYRYRSLEIAEVVGDDAAVALAGWDLMSPADLRAHLYRLANSTEGGFVGAAERSSFLATAAVPLGLTGDQLSTLLTLDAEPHQRLIRIGPKPESADVVARYNLILLSSVLRNASPLEISTPGLDPMIVDTVLSRYGVDGRRSGSDSIRLVGRRNAFGSWASFGPRVSRVALHLLVLSPRPADLHAVIHLGDQVSELTLDGKSLANVIPAQRGAADAAGVIRATILDEDVTAHRRRRASVDFAGWSVRRLSDPIVASDAMLLPDLAFVRGNLVVPIVAIPTGLGREISLNAAQVVGAQRPVVALGAFDAQRPSPGVYALSRPDAGSLIEVLDTILADYTVEATPQTMLWSELEETGWVSATRMSELFTDTTLPVEIQRWLDDGLAAIVPGFGMGRTGFLDDMTDRFASGPADIGSVRGRIAAEIGDGPAADALTLHLLAQHLVSPTPSNGETRHAVAA